MMLLLEWRQDPAHNRKEFISVIFSKLSSSFCRSSLNRKIKNVFIFVCCRCGLLQCRPCSSCCGQRENMVPSVPGNAAAACSTSCTSFPPQTTCKLSQGQMLWVFSSLIEDTQRSSQNDTQKLHFTNWKYSNNGWRLIIDGCTRLGSLSYVTQ